MNMKQCLSSFGKKQQTNAHHCAIMKHLSLSDEKRQNNSRHHQHLLKNNDDCDNRQINESNYINRDQMREKSKLFVPLINTE